MSRTDSWLDEWHRRFSNFGQLVNDRCVTGGSPLHGGSHAETLRCSQAVQRTGDASSTGLTLRGQIALVAGATGEPVAGLRGRSAKPAPPCFAPGGA